MPRPDNFYEDPQNSTPSQPVVPVSNIQTPVINNQNTVTPTVAEVSNTQNIPTEKQAFWGSLLNPTYGMSVDPNATDAEKKRQLFQQLFPKQDPWAMAKKGANIIATLGREVVKAPLRLQRGSQYIVEKGFDVIDYGIDKITGTKSDSYRMGSKKYNLPLLGEVKGATDPYDEGIKMGLTPWQATVKATGEWAGDLAMSSSLIEAIGAAFMPRVSTVQPGIMGKDFRPLQADQVESIGKIKPGKTDISTGETINFGKAKQNTDITYLRVTNKVAAKYKGNANNTFLKISPQGEDVAEFSIVQIRNSLANQAKDFLTSKFGKSNVITGEMGPEIKLDSGTIKYNPNALVKTPYNAELNPLMNAGQSANLETVLGNMGTKVAATMEQQAIKYKTPGEFINKSGIIPEWGTQNQYYLNNPYRTQLDEMAKTKKFDENILAKSDEWEMKQVLENKPAYLNDGMLPDDQVIKFAQDNNLPTAIDSSGKLIIAKDQASLDAVVNATNQRDLGLALGYQDVGVLGEGKPTEAKNQLTQIWNKAQETKTSNINNSKLIDPYTRARLARKNPDLALKSQAPGAGGNELPAIMAKPLKGFEDSLVTNKQADQILGIAAERELSDVGLQAVIQTITGKNNLYELNQNEAYDVSEVARQFPGKQDLPESDKYLIFRSFTDPARYWMESAERNLQVPVYSEIYLRMETAFRTGKNFADRKVEESRTIFEKYSTPKYLEDRRLINSYVEGNKEVITNNKLLTPEQKTELTKLGDWLVNQYKDLFKVINVDSKKWFEIYAPKIRKMGGIKNLYKTADIPQDIKPFFEFERKGALSPLEDDALALYDIYVHAVSKKLFLAKPVEDANKLLEKMDKMGLPNLKAAANDYIQEKLGYEDKWSEYANDLGKRLSEKSGGVLPENIWKQTMDFFMITSYAGALGLPRIAPVPRNMAQPFLTTYPDLGARWFAEGIKRYAQKGPKELKDKGFLVEMGVPYGADLVSNSNKGVVRKSVKFYEDLNKASLKLYGSTDTISRGWDYYGRQARLEYNWNQFIDRKIDWDQFSREINLDGMNPTLQKVVADKLKNNTPESLEEAADLMYMDGLDNNQFPYRKGAESRLHYGLKGKLGLQFSQWTWEYVYTLKSWVARGQWDKVIRWMGISAAVKKTIEEKSNVDVAKWMALGPIGQIPIGPLGNAVIDTMSAINNGMANMTEDMNKNWKDVANDLKIYGGVLSGVGIQKIDKFWQSVKRYESGNNPSTDPNPDKKFGVWSSNGKLIRWVDFTELVQSLLGFESKSGSEQSQKINAIQKENTEYQMRMDKAMNYLVDGDYKNFDKMVTDNNLIINDIAAKMKSYSIPLDQRIFDRMPMTLKDKYLKVFYPEQ